MKSIKLFSFTAASIFFAFTMTIACNNNEAKESTSKDKTEVTVKTPKMPIHTAAYLGDVKAIKAHIEAGTDLNQKDQYGSTPLNVAITFGKTQAALALIDGGADLKTTSKDGSTPLHTAAFFCRKEIVEALLQKGVDTSIKNGYGSTALESISAEFSQVLPIYQDLNKNLGPLGLKLDYERIKRMRPIIAELIKKAQ
ncbi:MAG: ankyrin repeat domain-containing protein [Salinivirgaceae bacterium]|nr:MAG: ankyrin repeat domain-containing protein [Salinivirgaceae bacterium]